MRKTSNEYDLAETLWRHRGQKRPPFATEPAAGQESVWDYPRPPLMVPDHRLVEVRVGEHLIAQTRGAIRVLETASPPTFYLPPEDVRRELLQPAGGHSFCEWKGRASYFDVQLPMCVIAQAAWSYEQPLEAFARLADYIGFYPGRTACYVDGEPVRPQAGGFYGGWVTEEIVGPYKGEAGTGGW